MLNETRGLHSPVSYMLNTKKKHELNNLQNKTSLKMSQLSIIIMSNHNSFYIVNFIMDTALHNLRS